LPFITEELFQTLKSRLSGAVLNQKADPYTQESVTALLADTCMTAAYPQVVRESDINETIIEEFALIERIVYAVRNIRGEMKVPPSTATDIHVYATTPNTTTLKAIEKNQGMMRALLRCSNLSFHTNDPALSHASEALVGDIKLLIPIPADLFEREKERLSKELERLVTGLDKLRAQLDNSEFTSRAPQALVDKQRQQLLQGESELKLVQDKLKAMGV
jgi:valyl-tRNA synthetase